MLQNLGFLEKTQFSVFRVPDEIARIKRYLDSMIFAVELSAVLVSWYTQKREQLVKMVLFLFSRYLLVFH